MDESGVNGKLLIFKGIELKHQWKWNIKCVSQKQNWNIASIMIAYQSTVLHFCNTGCAIVPAGVNESLEIMFHCCHGSDSICWLQVMDVRWMSNYTMAQGLYWGYLCSHINREDWWSWERLVWSTCFFIHLSFQLVFTIICPRSDQNWDSNTITAYGKISVIIVWQTVANEKFKISADPRSQFVHTDPSVQDRPPSPLLPQPLELNKRGPI